MQCKVYESYRLGAAPAGGNNDKLNLYTKYLMHAQVFAFMKGKKGKEGGIFFTHGTVEAEHHLFKVPPNTYPKWSKDEWGTDAKGKKIKTKHGERMVMTDVKHPDPIKGTPSDHISAWATEYWKHMQAVMKEYNEKAEGHKCSAEEWELDGCSQRPGYMIIEMGMPAHGDKGEGPQGKDGHFFVREFETMTYGRSATNAPAMWSGAEGSDVQGNVLKDLCNAFNRMKGTVQAVVVGHTPRAVVADMLYNDHLKCLTFNGDTSMQGGPLNSKPGIHGAGDGRHHGCSDDVAEKKCGGESTVVISAKDDGTYDFHVKGQIRAKSGKLSSEPSQPQGEPEVFQKPLQHDETVNTGKGDEWTKETKQAQCRVCQDRHKVRFPKEEMKKVTKDGKEEEKKVPKDGKFSDEFKMQKRAKLVGNDPAGNTLCASGRGFGFDYDIQPNNAHNKIAQHAAKPSFKQVSFRGTSTRLRFPHEDHVDVWSEQYGDGAEGFPGDGITS